MKNKFLWAAILVAGLCLAPLAATQTQTNGPAVTNPPRYDSPLPAERSYPQAAAGYQAMPPDL
jgi:hypothetical protein